MSVGINQDTAKCRTCDTVLPLDDKHFYRYKGKFWIYRCISCCAIHNRTYYRLKADGNVRASKSPMAKDYPLSKIPKRFLP